MDARAMRAINGGLLKFSVRATSLFCILGTSSFSGCVLAQDKGNWTPQSGSFNKDYQECDANAPRPVSLPYPAMGVSSKRYCDALVSCMQERGYHLRKAATQEAVAEFLLSPAYLVAVDFGACMKYVGTAPTVPVKLDSNGQLDKDGDGRPPAN